MEEFRLRVDYK